MTDRYKTYLRERYRALLGYMGEIITIIGVLHLVPLAVIAFYPEEARLAVGFLLAGLPLVIFGAITWRLFSPSQPLSMSVQDGSVVVVIVWLVAVLSSMIPLTLSGGLTLSQAFFESMSGWSATGLTVIDVNSAPRIILFYRSFSQLMGAAGFAIIVLSAIAGPFAGVVAAEGRTDQLAPHVRHSASIVLRMYVGYNVFGILALKLAGMGWFDAINHAFTATATGGFSTQAASIGHWDNPVIEAVTMLLMLLGAINFFIAYTILRGKWYAVVRSGELRLMFLLLVVSIPLMVAMTTQLYASLERGLRVALFEVVSALTTTGFSSTNFHVFPDFGWLMLIILMLVGGGSGSTTGGIKLIRIYIMYKTILWEIRRAFMPRHMVNEPAIWHGDRRELLTDRQARQIGIFIGLYLFVMLIGTFILTAHGYSLRDSLFEFNSALSNGGMSSGITQPDLPVGLLTVLSVGMLLGRLEFFAVIVGALKLLHDTRQMMRLPGRRRPA